MLRKFLFLILFTITTFLSIVFPQVKNQVSLNNFYLWQLKDAVANTYGIPSETGRTEDSHWESYKIDKECDMFFEIKDDMPSYIYSIQITGLNKKMVPFAGIKLGDIEKKVIDLFGMPDEITKKEGNKSLFEYEDKNYSFLFKNKKLYSIKIRCYKDLFLDKWEVSSWSEIKKCILSKNVSSLIKYIRPDVEVYFNEQTFRLTKPLGLFTIDKNDIIYKLLFENEKSVLNQLLIDDGEDGRAIRMIENVGMGEVIKFHNNVIVDEIVLMPYDSILKLYEIHFKPIE